MFLRHQFNPFFLQVRWSITLFLVILCFPICFCNDVQWYDTCGNHFSCGNITHAGFPFWGGDARPEKCGYRDLELSCENNVTTTIHIQGMKYHVLDINEKTKVIKLARADFLQGICMESFINTTLNFELFDYAPGSQNFTVLYGCPPPYSPNPGQFTCKILGTNDTDGYPVEGMIGPSGCYASVVVPMLASSALQLGKWILSDMIGHGFEAIYKVKDADFCAQCEASRGRCGVDLSQNTTSCLCSDGSANGESTSCNSSTATTESHRKKLKITVISIASSMVGLAMIAVALLYFKQNLLILSKKERRINRDVEALLNRYGKQAPKRYSYKEIKQITSRFKEKLGEGGYGSVYKGKLQNGSLVAVKILKKTDSNGAEFTNEVASISETNHVNVVALLGYCFQGRKRALVYDFMPNGSLDKYIYSETTQKPLSWGTLHQIAVGIGRGLEYLHQGCRTRILHFDIKPHNILLDAKFCPKVSDFGLAKSYLQTKSLMTMSGMRGTPGYIAPEVFCSGFGGASHKSDVYSYGMLVLDLIGCRTNTTSGSEKTSSEMYFPNWIYKQFELKEDNELLGISRDDEERLKRKMVILSLWCIQTNPPSRPSISRAVEMLEGDLESLQIPPMPYLSSPPNTNPQNSSAMTANTIDSLTL